MKLKITLSLALIFSGIGAIMAAQPAQPSALRIVITPSKTDTRLKEDFILALRVENPAKTTQTVRVMSCSWNEEWRSNNRKILLIGQPCSANAQIDVEIPPGGAYTNEAHVYFDDTVSGKTTSFRLGFTSIGAKKTFWSNKVKLRVLPPQEAVQPSATPKESSQELDFLADIPSLKDLSLKMSEAELQDILHREKLEFKRSIEVDQTTTYAVQPKAHAIVLIGFRDGHCSGIQRMQN